MTAGGYVALGPASRYPLGSTTRISGLKRGAVKLPPLLLIHDVSGFWAERRGSTRQMGVVSYDGHVLVR